MEAPELVVLSSARQCRELEALQERVWDRSVVMPAPHLLASIKAGGIALAAYHQQQPVAFCWGFPAVCGDRSWFYSHMLGVLPAFRRRGLARRLKLAQRCHALAAGFDLITWTFDPLRLGNALLNIAALGAVGSAYYADYYGELADPINRGLPTDRLLVSWQLQSPRVRAAAAGASATVGHDDASPIAVLASGDGLPRLERVRLDLTAPRLALAIPTSIDDIRRADPDLAGDWRLKTGAALSRYLGAGYGAVAVLPGTVVSHYILELGWQHDHRPH